MESLYHQVHHKNRIGESDSVVNSKLYALLHTIAISNEETSDRHQIANQIEFRIPRPLLFLLAASLVIQRSGSQLEHDC
jgi:hypothetical protein